MGRGRLGRLYHEYLNQTIPCGSLMKHYECNDHLCPSAVNNGFSVVFHSQHVVEVTEKSDCTTTAI